MQTEAKTRAKARRTVKVELSPSLQLAVSIDFHDGRGMERVLGPLDLSKVPGQPAVPILSDISFSVGRGGSLTLVGPSGSGKSTLLRCLNRLAEPTQGSVRFHDRDITALDPLDLRRRAALVLQTPVLFEGTVRQNLLMRPATPRTELSETQLAHALAEVGLEPGFLDRDGATLSGGEKQRVTISRALLACNGGVTTFVRMAARNAD